MESGQIRYTSTNVFEIIVVGFCIRLKLDGHVLSIDGVAESNNRISSEMRNLEASEWFKEPNLKGIKENTAAGAQASNFQLTVTQTSPKKAGADAAEGE